MISPSALIPQGSSTMLHFSPFSTTPTDKRSVLLCQSAKFKFRDREKENVNKVVLFYGIFFPNLKVEKGENLKFFVVSSSFIPNE